MIALLAAAVITLWLGIGALGTGVVLGAGALARRRGGGGMEDLVDATREDPHPDFAEWERQWSQWTP